MKKNFKILDQQGDPNLAKVYVAQLRSDPRFLAEFAEAQDSQLTLAEKWVIIISSQFGCPLNCLMCDAGGNYRGNLTAEEIFLQSDYLVDQKYPGRQVPSKKFKVQFARMGEPALNPEVLKVLRELPHRYEAPGLVPCIATTVPVQAQAWMNDLLEIKHIVYEDKIFQLQFSVNSTERRARERLMPFEKWDLKQISRYGEKFYKKGERRPCLNFVLTCGVPVESKVIADYFDPAVFCVKLTPLNPTEQAKNLGLKTAWEAAMPPKGAVEELARQLKERGFEVILSAGDPRENQIGSNCGMRVRKFR